MTGFKYFGYFICLCLGPDEHWRKDPCVADKGGPLICNDNGTAMLIGVYSFRSVDRCTNRDAAIYNQVTFVLDWINSSLYL